MSTSTTSSTPKLQASTIFCGYCSIAATRTSCGCFASNDSPQAASSLDERLAIIIFSPPFTLEAARDDFQLRATFSPSHPLARRDVPLTRARAFQSPIFLCPSLGEWPGCPLRASNEHFLNVRVLRARRAPDRSP